MMLKKTLSFAVLAASAALMLAGCSQAVPNDSAPKASQHPAAKSSRTPAPSAAKPFNVSGFLAGNVTPTFPAGEPGKVAVVAEGTLDKEQLGATLPFVYRNNTNAAIAHVDFSVTARVGGKLVATGQTQGGGIPSQVQPGEAAVGYVYFEDPSAIPDSGATYDFTVQTLPADTSSYNTAPLNVTEANHNGTSIVGSAVNKTGKELTGPYGVYAYCFDGDNVTRMVQSFANPDGDLAAGGQVSFTIDLFDTKCDNFTLGASGYFK